MERTDDTPCLGCGSYRRVVECHPQPNPTGGFTGRYDETTKCGSCGKLLDYRAP